jgi:hypothetical protein
LQPYRRIVHVERMHLPEHGMQASFARLDRMS